MWCPHRWGRNQHVLGRLEIEWGGGGQSVTWRSSKNVA